MRDIVALALVLTCFISCSSNAVFDEYKTVSQTWDKNEIITFQFEPTDTVAKHDLFVNIRNNNDYEFSNLYIIVKMNFPKGQVIADTLQYEMAYPDGKWMGSGFTDVKENKLWYKEKLSFPSTGKYQIEIAQAMRKNGEIPGVNNLKGITEVGFSIEKAPNN